MGYVIMIMLLLWFKMIAVDMILLGHTTCIQTAGSHRQPTTADDDDEAHKGRACMTAQCQPTAVATSLVLTDWGVINSAQNKP